MIFKTGFARTHAYAAWHTPGNEMQVLVYLRLPPRLADLAKFRWRGGRREFFGKYVLVLIQMIIMHIIKSEQQGF